MDETLMTELKALHVQQDFSLWSNKSKSDFTKSQNFAWALYAKKTIENVMHLFRTGKFSLI